MIKIAKPLLRVIESFGRLPGIGPKTAQRLTYYLLHVPQSYLEEFAQSLEKLKKETVLCSICKNVGEADPCVICSDSKRDASVIMVVESPIDILVFEQTGNYNGLYHVLHGAINPLENIGPDEIYIDDLFQRFKNGSPVQELILATNPTMEGEATAMFISKKLKTKSQKLKITRLGRGVPTGADIEHADSVTLTQALEGRRAF
ncbi:recombination protein RecR [Candidatus Woesebacteria bacterium RIFCSPHIGHO2_01_FULL_44_10]|uniref:Recombination protein RecR n=1 Tax=Candidatus Woesebacteria bacterium RIFCSPLOWO2_01_FULL_44_14 TaxID=1802525 RepID=A0A1F8C3N2_9BACT|nr:MAG: recombination protein RecR [Candidatus Woesebacteria bacterium RIFCSPHIGHO2_01_FULL_44_10]OGM55620.1 MAG: recombination protein RecR [Candidatus Woesebacteria bacterium RIFCSPHIGHO2_12_FULL_44_11]OGM70893.1 MAG: recombination protein RecR [Candidatus Woesebacteria bacterium RIFCSPLOWO2_01_FULL_44_14]